MDEEHYAPTDLLDAISDHQAVVHSIARRIESIANSMNNLGLMQELASELYQMADHLTASAKSVAEANSLSIKDHLYHSQAMTGLLLQATLKGVLGPRRGASA